MTKELFEKAKFGDRFVTRGGQEALFLRLTENSEWQFADFYVKDWGQIRVNRENGKCINGPDMENDIVGMMPFLPSGLDEAAEEYAYTNWEDNDYHTGASEGLPFDAIVHTEKCFKAGAEWMAGKYEKIEGELVDWYSTSDGKDYCCGVKTTDSFEAPEGFYIRKKQ